jgi:hypothetical protein
MQWKSDQLVTTQRLQEFFACSFNFPYTYSSILRNASCSQESPSGALKGNARDDPLGFLSALRDVGQQAAVRPIWKRHSIFAPAP